MSEPHHSSDHCSWCGLPLPSRWKRNDEDGNVPEFCCFGCRFASQVTQERGEAGQVQWTLTRLGIAIFFAMNVSMFTMALWSHDVYQVDPTDRFAALLTELMIWLSFLCAVPVLFLLGIPIAVSAGIALRSGRITTELLVIGGVVAAFGYSVVSVLNGSGHIYFEVASLVLVLVTLGRWLEASGRLQASEALDSLSRLLPKMSRLADSDHEIATEELRPGDVIRILPGERIPADGVIANQPATIDEQMLTGESIPVLKLPGEEVSSGTLNLDAELIVRVTRAIEDGAVHRLMRVMRDARQAQGYYQRLADRVTSWFVPLAGLMAMIAVVANLLVSTAADAIMAGLAVVLIACPCALGLATSVAVWTALGTAAKRGVLIRNGEVLERLARIKAVRFDKTGTLTTGEARVTEVICALSTNRDEALRRAGALATRSSHAYSRAITAEMRSVFTERSIGRELSTSKSLFTSEVKLNEVRAVPGRGLSGSIVDENGESETLWLGSRTYLESQGCVADVAFETRLKAAAFHEHGVVFAGWNGRIQVAFLLEEFPRAEVSTAVRDCERLGLQPAVLSGDRPERGRQFALATGLHVQAGLLPEDKLAALKAVRERIGPVLMVGDGINDAPALAAADVGVALGCGTDVSRDAAGVCLLTNDLRRVPWVIELGQLTRRIILQNLAWAFGYNAIGMTLAAFGKLNPVIAAILMFVSSLVVLANSRRLKSAAETDADGAAGNSVRMPREGEHSSDELIENATPRPEPSELLEVGA